MDFLTVSIAFSIPLLSAIGSAPAATFLNPSAIIACASTVDVVVPSPASSFVFFDASFSNCAPILAKESSRSISFAIVTPSELTWGGPNFLSTITLRPLGPNVALTVLANASTPSFKWDLASSPNFISFAGILFLQLF